MALDLTKPIELMGNKPIVDANCNLWTPGIYRPGELPYSIVNEANCRNVTATLTDRGIAQVEPLNPMEPPPPTIKAKVTPIIDQPKININTADINEISKLEQVGTATANKIITEREKGDFKDLNDLLSRLKNLSGLSTVLADRLTF